MKASQTEEHYYLKMVASRYPKDYILKYAPNHSTLTHATQCNYQKALTTS